MAKKKRKILLKPSKAYSVFEKTIERSLNLTELAKPVEVIITAKKTDAHVDASDLLRASLVLGVSAMDSYFTGVFAERFVRYVQKKGVNEKIVEILKKANVTIEVALELLSMERPYRRLRTLIDVHLSKCTTQSTGVIDDLFLAFCIKDFSNNISKLKRRRSLISSINSAVNRRHKIVHEGDLNSHGNINKLTERDAKRKLKDIILFVAGADEILRNQL